MRKLYLIFYFLLLSHLGFSQTTTTTATVRYPDGQPFINGIVTAVFTPPTGVQDQGLYKLNGAAFPYTVSGTMDGTGTFILILTDDHKVQPQGGRWSFSVCSQATVPCNTSLQDVFGSSIDLSTLISNDVVSIHASASNLPRYYSDNEVDTNTTGGQSYYNLLSGTVRCWNGMSWADCGNPGGGTSSAVLFVSPGVLHFGVQQNNVPGQPQTITLTNIGDMPIFVTGFTSTGSTNFQSSDPNHCNISYQSGQSCTLLFFYEPTSGIAETRTIKFTTVSPVDPQSGLTVVMDGSGTPNPTFNVTVDGGSSTGTGTVKTIETPPLINCGIANPLNGDCGNSYETGTSVTVNAIAANGTFDHFSGTGSAGACGINPSCTFTVTANSNISAIFNVPVPTFNLNIVAGPGQGQGTITSSDGQISCTITAGILSGSSCHGTYNQGDTPTLTETPFAGCVGGACTFNNWGGAPPPIITGCTNTSTCQPTINNDTNISVSFSLANAGAPLQLIQVIPGGTQGSNSIAGIWPQAQLAGDTNIIGIQFNDATTTVTSVTDAAGNTYAQLGGGCSPKAGNGNTTAVYIANNIVASAANTNTVVVLLSATPSYRAILGHEVSGLQNPPLDVCNGATGASSTVNAGNLVTTNANDYLFSNSIVSGGINTPSSGWTQQIHFKGNDTEDRTVTATGTYNNSAPQTGATFSSIDAAFKTQGIIAVQFSVTIVGASGSSGSGVVTASGLNCPINNGIAGTTGCSVIVAANSTLALSATALTGSGFITFQGSGCSNNPQCPTQAITTNSVISVNFQPVGVVNFYVAPSPIGNDARSVTQAQNPATPWATCAHAVANAILGPSGTIINYAASATAYPGCSINKGGSSPTVRVVHKCQAQWTVGGTNCRWADNWVITATNNVDIGAPNRFGFEYTNPNDNFGFEVAWQCAQTATTCNFGNSIHFIGNYLHDIAQTAVGPTGVGCPQSAAILAPTQHNHFISDFWAVGNQVDHFGVSGGTTCSEAHDIYVASGGGTVSDNIATRGAAAALQYYDQACNAKITNNVFANSRFGIIVYGSNGCTPGINTVSNNAVVNNSSTGIYTGFNGSSDCSPGRNILIANNDLFGNGTNFNNPSPSCETRQGTVSENPTSSFTNYTGTASGTYTLKGPSILNHAGTLQCVAGGSGQCTPSFNFNGVPFSGFISIGVF